MLKYIYLIQQACYANDEMYQIMKTGSTAYMGCQDGRGEYPTGGTMGKAFCLFDTLGLVSITSFFSTRYKRIQKNPRLLLYNTRNQALRAWF